MEFVLLCGQVWHSELRGVESAEERIFKKANQELAVLKKKNRRKKTSLIQDGIIYQKLVFSESMSMYYIYKKKQPFSF